MNEDPNNAILYNLLKREVNTKWTAEMNKESQELETSINSAKTNKASQDLESVPIIIEECTEQENESLRTFFNSQEIGIKS